jgi:hypothetical protein
MRSLTLAILAIATLSMISSTTTETYAAETYAPNYRCTPTASGRCIVDPNSAAHWRYFDGGRRYFISRGPHYNLGPDCATKSMWSWPFTC